jgi:ketopantoate reductase
VRFIIYGAGAIGATLGARLHQGGHEVVLIARGAHGDALREQADQSGMSVDAFLEMLPRHAAAQS